MTLTENKAEQLVTLTWDEEVPSNTFWTAGTHFSFEKGHGGNFVSWGTFWVSVVGPHQVLVSMFLLSLLTTAHRPSGDHLCHRLRGRGFLHQVTPIAPVPRVAGSSRLHGSSRPSDPQRISAPGSVFGAAPTSSNSDWKVFLELQSHGSFLARQLFDPFAVRDTFAVLTSW